ncbi:MAG: hypothetical protein HFE77_00790 [Clostridiales bacterium]|nr:hypothetical protein [Clostridiales bacterium]
MKTNNDSGKRPLGPGAPMSAQTNRQQPEPFRYKPADSKIVDDVRREEEARLNVKQASSGRPQAGASAAGTPTGEYQFFATNSVKRMDTQTVHRMMTTTSLAIPTVPGGKRKAMTKKKMAALLVPLCLIVAYILSVVCIDLLGLFGYHFRMTPLTVILYILYLLLSAVGVLLLMFMDMMPKPLALLVVFTSLFCVHGNVFLMVPLILSFVAVGITIEGMYPRICVCGIAVFMAFYACVLGVNQAKILRAEEKVSEDGKYILTLQTEDDGKELTYTLILETTGGFYKKYEVETGFVDIYYFGEGKTVAYGESNEYGQPKTVKTAKIADIIK